MNIPPKLVYAIAGLVVALWAGFLVISSINKNIEMPPAINGLAMSIIGAAVAKLGTDKASSNKDKSDTGSDT